MANRHISQNVEVLSPHVSSQCDSSSQNSVYFRHFISFIYLFIFFIFLGHCICHFLIFPSADHGELLQPTKTWEFFFRWTLQPSNLMSQTVSRSRYAHMSFIRRYIAAIQAKYTAAWKIGIWITIEHIGRAGIWNRQITGGMCRHFLSQD